jgi:predicted flavoprotein YhiN
MAQVFPTLCDLPPEKPANQITKPERRRLAAAFKALPLPVTGLRGYDEAVITRGGVETKEVVPGTMASRITKGLYFAGELLDVDGYTGGFNLQIAFSTGACAGKGAAAFLREG